LYNIKKNCGINLMSSSCLGEIFGPLLHRGTKLPPGKIPTRKNTGEGKPESWQLHVNRVVEHLILYFDTIFEDMIEAQEAQVKEGRPFLRFRLVVKSIQNISYIKPTEKIPGMAITAMGSLITGYDLETGSVLKKFEEHPAGEDRPITFVRLEVDAEGQCSGRIWVMKEQSASIYDVKSRSALATVPRGGTSMTQSQDEMWFNSPGVHKIYVYDIKTFQEKTVISAPEENTKIPGFSQLATFGDKIWSGSYSGAIGVWDSTTRNLLTENRTVHRKKINTFVQMDNSVLSGSDDGLICVWSQTTYAMEKRVDSHAGKIKHLSFFNDTVYCTNWEMTIKMYSKNFELVNEVKEHTDSVTGLIFHYSAKQRRWLMWSASYDGTLCVFTIPQLLKGLNTSSSFS